MTNNHLHGNFNADNQPANNSIDNSLGDLSYLHDQLDIEIIEIQAAVSAVGDSPDKVERYLKDRLGFNNRD